MPQATLRWLTGRGASLLDAKEGNANVNFCCDFLEEIDGTGSAVPILGIYGVFAMACAAALRKQSRHRQSSPSSGIGGRADSSAHQHEPARLQVNSVPHREQARRREG